MKLAWCALLCLLPGLALAQAPQPTIYEDLVSDLGSKDSDRRRRAVEAFEQLGPRAASAVRPLLEAAAKAPPLRSSYYQSALSAIGEAALPELKRALEDGERPLLQVVVIALARLKEKGYPTLEAALVHERQPTRLEATEMVQSLMALKEEVDRFLPQVRERLQAEDDPAVRKQLWFALAYCGRLDAHTIAVRTRLEAEIAKPKGEIPATLGLAILRGNAQPSLPLMLQFAVHHPDPAMRAGLVWALGALIAPPGAIPRAAAPGVLEFLITALKDPAAEVRKAAAQRLGYLHVPRALPELRRVRAEDPDAEVRDWAGKTIDSMTR